MVTDDSSVEPMTDMFPCNWSIDTFGALLMSLTDQCLYGVCVSVVLTKLTSSLLDPTARGGGLVLAN